MVPNKPYIVGLGVACMDYIVVAPAVNPGEESPVEHFAILGGGLTGTALVAASRLGASAKLLGRLGDDQVGDDIVRGLELEGVDCKDVIRVPGGKSLISVVIVDSQTAERTIYCRRDSDVDCVTDEVNLDCLAGADAVVLDPHWAEGALVTAKRAKDLGIPVICDIRYPMHHLDVLGLSDYPILSRFSALTMIDSNDPAEAVEKIRTLGPRAAVVTCGHEGAYYSDGKDEGYVSAFEVDAVDTTGAGDVFHGAFAVALAHGWGMRDRVVFASAVSAVMCTKIGGRAGIPTMPEALAFLESRGVRLTAPNA